MANTLSRTYTGAYSGTLLDAGTLTANGDSGWVAWPVYPVTAAFLRYEPAGLATDETLDLVLTAAFDDDGNGDFTVHTFTQTTSSNAAQNLVLPGGESGALLAVANESSGTPLPAYYKLTWTLGGTTKSMTFVMYAALVG